MQEKAKNEDVSNIYLATEINRLPKVDKGSDKGLTVTHDGKTLDSEGTYTREQD